MGRFLGLAKSALDDFFEDGCIQMAAALSYFTVFSLPPLLMLVLLLTGPFLGPSVEGRITEEIGTFVGPEGGRQIEAMLRSAQQIDADGSASWFISSVALLLGATAALSQLQTALNVVWDVKVDPESSPVKTFLTKRLLSLGMILTLGFLLMVSLVLNTTISWTGSVAKSMLPEWTSELLLQMLEIGAAITLFTLLFAAIFVVLPDAVVAWRDVWAGAFATAVLLSTGQLGIGFYLGRADLGSTFGSAGSLALVLVWVYYSALIFLFGAELTQAWAASRGREIVPEKGALRRVVD